MRVNQKPKKEVLSPQEKKTIHNCFIVDASGSMSGGKYNNAIGGLNELLKSINEDSFTDNTVTIVEFEGSRIQSFLNMAKSPTNYQGMGCGGTTPLNQAVGETIEKLLQGKKTGEKVLVNVFTDGGENSSYGKYKDKEVLSKLIKDVEKNHEFTVTFVGTKEEVDYAINGLNLFASNTFVHDNTMRGVQTAFMATNSARIKYSKGVSEGLDVKENFYSKEVQKEDNKS